MTKNLDSLISALDSDLIGKYKNDRKLFEKLDKAQEDLGILSGKRPFARVLRPQFMTRRMYDEIAHAAEVLTDAMETMTQAALVNDEVMSELALTETEERYARMDPGYIGVCNSSRFDAFIAGSSFKFLEYNGETPAGITDQMQIEKVLSLIPEVGEFLAKNPHWLPMPHVKLLEGLVAAYHDFGGEKAKPNIAIIDWTGVSTFTEFEILQTYFESEGHETMIADPGDLDYDGKSLRIDGFAVDILYKRVLIHELFERADEDHPFLRAYRDGNVCMANSFRTKIPHKKASLAVLGTERFEHLYSTEHLEMINKHLPWTRRISDRKTRYNDETVDLIDFTRREKDRLILKPNDDYGGSGIVIGWESSESEWDTAIDNALEVPFVVQERAEVEKIHFPTYDEEAALEELLIDFDPFIFRGKVEGGLIRLSPQTLVNVAVGGAESSLVVLEDF